MTEVPAKPKKKEKAKSQTPEERREALRYNHIMYGPTAHEYRPPAKRVDYGAVYLRHPKFQALMTAFKNGSASEFTVADKGKTHTIATDGELIRFNGIVLFYSRSLNRFERNLLLDCTAAVQFQAVDACVHLVFAVMRSLPELDAPHLAFWNGEFHLGEEELDAVIPVQGPNLMIGAFRSAAAKAR